MAVVNYDIVIDLGKPISNTIMVKKDDDKARMLTFTFISNGRQYKLKDNDTVNIRAVLPDDSRVFAACDVTDKGTATFVLTDDMLARKEGKIDAEISIFTEDGETLNSFVFYILVDNLLYDEEQYVTEDDMSGIKSYLARALDAANRAEGYADDIEEVKEEADVIKTQAEAISQSIEASKDHVDQVAAGVDAYVAQAQAAADSADTSKTVAEQAAQEAQQTVSTIEQSASAAAQSASDAKLSEEAAYQEAQDASASSLDATRSASRASVSEVNAKASADMAEYYADQASKALPEGLISDVDTLKSDMIIAQNDIGALQDETEELSEGYAQLVDDVTEQGFRIQAQNNKLIELKMLGWNTPSESPIQNEVNGNVFTQKVGRVDLGSLSWEIRDTSRFVNDSVLNIKQLSQNTEISKMYTYKYDVTSRIDLIDKHISLAPNGTWLNVIDSAYSDASTFKSAMNGIYLYYELATPITMTIDGAEKFQEMMDIKMLGWSVPSGMPIKNAVNGNTFIQRVGRVDMGTLTWIYQNNYMFARVSDKTHNGYADKLYCTKYPTANKSSDFVDKTMSGVAIFYGNNVCIKDSDYTVASTFKSAVQGIYLYYELETAKNYTIDGNERSTLSIVSDGWVSKGYNAGDLVIWNNILKKCKITHATAIEPSDTTYWEDTSVANELKETPFDVTAKDGYRVANSRCYKQRDKVHIQFTTVNTTALTRGYIAQVPSNCRPNVSTAIALSVVGNNSGGTYYSANGFLNPSGDIYVISDTAMANCHVCGEYYI